MEAKTSLIPVLSLDIRRDLETYGRLCNTEADCDPPLGCLFLESELRAECTDSMCMRDEDCPEEFSCVSPLALTHHLGCERGLHCQEGWCVRRSPTDPGYYCLPG